MSSKKQIQRYGKDSSTQPRSRPTIEYGEQAQQSADATHSSPAAHDLVYLQRTVGNRAVGTLLEKATSYRPAQIPTVQTIILQRQYEQANWKAMNEYNSGSAGKAVSDAFNKAGYTIDEIPRLVIGLMGRNGFGKDRFGHGTGDDTQGQQGDTTPKIEECKRFLIDWAIRNPKGQQEKKQNNSRALSEKKQNEARVKKEKEKKKKKEKKHDLYEEYVNSLPPEAQNKADTKGFAEWKKQNGYF